MDRKVVRRTFVAFMLLTLVTPRVFGSAIIGATEPTQWLNNLAIILNTIEAYQSKLDHFKNTVRDGLEPFYDVKTRLDTVRDTVKGGFGLAYSLQNIDDVFKLKYKDFDDFMQPDYDQVQYTQDLKTWTQTTKDSIKNALSAAGIQMESLDDEEVIMQQLYDKAKSGGVGRQKAIDVANEIAVMSSRQMQSLRQLVATDMQIKAAYFQQETVKSEVTAAAVGEYYNPTITPDPLPIRGNSASENFPQVIGGPLPQ